MAQGICSSKCGSQHFHTYSKLKLFPSFILEALQQTPFKLFHLQVNGLGWLSTIVILTPHEDCWIQRLVGDQEELYHLLYKAITRLL